MLIVIVIIGILAAALVPRLQDVQGRARDTKRKTDISQIQSALIIYHTDKGNYPPSYGGYNTNTYNMSTSGSNWISGLTGIITQVPQDPKNNAPRATAQFIGSYAYVYGFNWKNGKTFRLNAQLENRKDPDRCEITTCSYFNNGTVLTFPADCGGGINDACPYYYLRSDLGP